MNNAYNSTVPVPASFAGTTPHPAITVKAGTLGAGSFTMSWNSRQGSTYDVLKATSVTGPWTTAATGYPTGGATGVSTSYTDSSANSSAAFYLVRAR